MHAMIVATVAEWIMSDTEPLQFTPEDTVLCGPAPSPDDPDASGGLVTDLKRLTLQCASAWLALDAALRDGTELPDQLREALHHACVALDMAGAQLVAHVQRGDSTQEDA